MPTFHVHYAAGSGPAGGADQENLEAEGFRLEGGGDWMDFYDAGGTVTLRVRAEHIVRIERAAGAGPAAAAQDPGFDPEEEELAG